MKDFTKTRKRTSLYAAFSDAGEPAINVWDFFRPRLLRLVQDRAANGEALKGEHIVRVTIEMYNRLMTERGWPLVSP